MLYFIFLHRAHAACGILYFHANARALTEPAADNFSQMHDNKTECALAHSRDFLLNKKRHRINTIVYSVSLISIAIYLPHSNAILGVPSGT